MNAAVNIRVQALWGHMSVIRLGVYAGVQFLGHMVTLRLII